MFCENDLKCVGFVYQYQSSVCAFVDSFTGDCTEDLGHMTGFLNRYECSNNHNCENSFVEFADINVQHGVGQRKRYCGNTIPPMFNSLGSDATITTQHDGSGRNPTFKARVKGEACNRVIKDSSGVILSHFGGGYYPQNLNCQIRIQGEQGSKVAIFFSFFDLECSDSCRNDKLVIGNRVTHCCKELPEPYFYAGTYLQLDFTTDGNDIVGEGFKADYTCNHSGCGGKLSGYSGYLYPYNWPQLYDSSQNCEWQISSADDTSMYVKIEELNIYPNGTDKDSSCFDDEYLQIFEASPQDPHKKNMLKTCGVGSQPPITIYPRYGPRALATVVFRTGNRSRSGIEGSWNGFKINWYQKE